MKKIIVITFLVLSLGAGKSIAQGFDIDQWWVTFGIGNAFEGFKDGQRGLNMSGNINVHSGKYYYQIGLDDSGVPIFSDKTMGAIHFDVGQCLITDYYMLTAFGGLGIMNYAYSDVNSKIQNKPTIGINLNANLTLKPLKLIGVSIEPYCNLRYRHTVSGIRLVLMLGDGI